MIVSFGCGINYFNQELSQFSSFWFYLSGLPRLEPENFTIIMLLCLSYSCLFQMVQIFVRLQLFSLITCTLALIFLSNRHRTIIPLFDSDGKSGKDYKYILTWTPDSGNVKLMGWSYPDLDGFKKAGCPEFRCYLTNNRTYLGTEVL